MAGYSFTVTIPDILKGKIDISKPYGNYNANGNLTSHGVDLEFEELELYKSIKSREPHLLHGMIDDTLRSWEEKYINHQERLHKEDRAASVDEMNEEASGSINDINTILHHTLDLRRL